MAIKDTCKFGAFIIPPDGLSRIEAIQAWEARYGIRLDVINDFRKAGYMSYVGASGHIPTAMSIMKSSGIQGRRHCMTWEWCAADTKLSSPWRPVDIISSTSYDWYIRDFAIALRDWIDDVTGQPKETIIRLFHEMNSNWYGWALDPQCFKDAWKKIVQIFRDNGANNVKWYWCSNGGDVPNQWNKMEYYYPGDEWVDIIGFDQYNAYSGWHPFSELIGPPYNRCKALGPSKPIWIGETGTPETSGSIPGATGHTKSEWYTEMFNATGFDDLEYILMFDSPGGFNWRIDTTTTSRDTFAALVQATTLKTLPPGTGGGGTMSMTESSA